MDLFDWGMRMDSWDPLNGGVLSVRGATLEQGLSLPEGRIDGGVVALGSEDSPYVDRVLLQPVSLLFGLGSFGDSYKHIVRSRVGIELWLLPGRQLQPFE